MPTHAVVSSIDPQVTESFLMSFPDVVDASVWFSQGDMMAHVTLDGDVVYSPRDFQRACLESLGLHQTPRRVLLLMAQRLTA